MREQRKRVAACAVALVLALGSFAAAENFVVRKTGDDVDTVGTLRNALFRARDGDRISFDVLGTIRLTSDLDVRQGLRNVRIRGPVRLASALRTDAKLSVSGDRISLENLDVRRLRVVVEPAASDVEILGCRFEGVETKLHVDGARGTVIGSRDRPNLFQRLKNNSTAGSCFVLTNDVDTQVVGNVLRGIQSTIDLDASVGVEIRGNRFVDAGIDGSPHSARIVDNDIRLPASGGRGNGILIQESPSAPNPGLVEVLRNRVRISAGTGAIDVIRPNAIVADNVVQGSSGRGSLSRGIVVGAGHPFHVDDFEISVRDNRVVGCTTAYLLLTSAARDGGRTGTLVVEGNTARRFRTVGMSVIGGPNADVTVRDNVLTRGGRRGASDVAALTLRAEEGPVLAIGNTVRRNRMPGIEVVADGPVTLTTNTIERNRGDGVLVSSGAALFSADANTITRNAGAGYRLIDVAGAISFAGGNVDDNDDEPVVLEGTATLTVVQ